MPKNNFYSDRLLCARFALQPAIRWVGLNLLNGCGHCKVGEVAYYLAALSWIEAAHPAGIFRHTLADTSGIIIPRLCVKA